MITRRDFTKSLAGAVILSALKTDLVWPFEVQKVSAKAAELYRSVDIQAALFRRCSAKTSSVSSERSGSRRRIPMQRFRSYVSEPATAS